MGASKQARPAAWVWRPDPIHRGWSLIAIGQLLVIVGVIVVVGAVLTFFLPYLFLHWFTYRLWIFHVLIAAGMALAAAGWLAGGNGILAVLALAFGTVWFVLLAIENHLPGSRRLAVGPGDRLPPLELQAVDGTDVTHDDIAAAAPALLMLYRGWWCPTSRMQLDDILDAYDRVAAAGVTVFAASVDPPELAAPLQEVAGDRARILCGLDERMLDAIGAHDTRGRPWFLRPFVGGRDETTAMPTALVIGSDGRIIAAHRADHVDDRPVPPEWLREPAFASVLRA